MIFFLNFCGITRHSSSFTYFLYLFPSLFFLVSLWKRFINFVYLFLKKNYHLVSLIFFFFIMILFLLWSFLFSSFCWLWVLFVLLFLVQKDCIVINFPLRSAILHPIDFWVLCLHLHWPIGFPVACCCSVSMWLLFSHCLLFIFL